MKTQLTLENYSWHGHTVDVDLEAEYLITKFLPRTHESPAEGGDVELLGIRLIQLVQVKDREKLTLNHDEHISLTAELWFDINIMQIVQQYCESDAEIGHGEEQ